MGALYCSPLPMVVKVHGNMGFLFVNWLVLSSVGFARDTSVVKIFGRKAVLQSCYCFILFLNNCGERLMECKMTITVFSVISFM